LTSAGFSATNTPEKHKKQTKRRKESISCPWKGYKPAGHDPGDGELRVPDGGGTARAAQEGCSPQGDGHRGDPTRKQGLHFPCICTRKQH